MSRVVRMLVLDLAETAVILGFGVGCSILRTAFRNPLQSPLLGAHDCHRQRINR